MWHSRLFYLLELKPIDAHGSNVRYVVYLDSMGFSEVLKQITADELHGVVDANIDAIKGEQPETDHLAGYLGKEYPEFVKFAHETVSRYFASEEEIPEGLGELITMNTAITLAALCRAVETRELPQL